jgi:hypothetical protein
MDEHMARLRALEGRRVGIALRDGSHVDDAELVSAGRGVVGSVWLFGNGVDSFARLDDVVDVWEIEPHRPAGRRRVACAA